MALVNALYGPKPKSFIGIGLQRLRLSLQKEIRIMPYFNSKGCDQIPKVRICDCSLSNIFFK